MGGVAYSDRKYRSDGFNTIGFTTVAVPGCPTTQAGCNTRNQTTGGYGNANQAWPTTVPAGYNFGANGGTLEHAQQIAAHASPKTTKLYDRTANTISLDEIERIVI
jgi:hypothetical protein